MKMQVLDLIRNNNKLASKQSLAAIQHIRQELKMLKDRGTEKYQIDKVREVLIEQATLDLIETNKKDLQKLNSLLVQLKQNYINDVEKNYVKRSRDIDNAKRKINAMSSKEVEAEALSIMDKKLNETIYPEYLEELSIALKSSNSEIFEPFRGYLRNNSYDEPWLNSEIGKDIKGDIDFLQNNISMIMIKTEDARRGGSNLSDLNSFLDAEEE